MPAGSVSNALLRHRRVYCALVLTEHGAGCAREDEQLISIFGQAWHQLNSCCAGGDLLVSQLLQLGEDLLLGTACDSVVSPRSVDHIACENVQACVSVELGDLWRVKVTGRQNDKLGFGGPRRSHSCFATPKVIIRRLYRVSCFARVVSLLGFLCPPRR